VSEDLRGTWVARNADSTAVYVFGSEIDAFRFVNREGYYMEVLLVPHGEDARNYRPPKPS
jgi:hypothetical protein